MNNLPYQHSLDAIGIYQKIINYFVVKEKEVALISGKIPESAYVQKRIYDKTVCVLNRKSIDVFVNEVYNKDELIKNSNSMITSTELNKYQSIDEFIANFEEEIIEREKVLEKQVNKCVDEVINWNPNIKLVKANYLKIMAKDKLSEQVLERTVPISNFYDEETINMMLYNHPEEFLPYYARLVETNQKIKYSDVELLGVMNITTLYDPNKVKSKEVKIDEAEYIFQSRIKRSYRELEKFVELLLNKRYTDDLPYDAIAMIAVMPTPSIRCTNKNDFINNTLVNNANNINNTITDNTINNTITDNTITSTNNMISFNKPAIDKILDGSKIYKFKDFVLKKISKYEDVLLENVMQAENLENYEYKKIIQDNKILKLKENYDETNFNQVIAQINATTKEIKDEALKKRMPNGSYIITDIRKECLLQGMKLGTIVDDHTRMEIWVMNPLMYATYGGELIGHTSSYVKSRKDRRMQKLDGLLTLATLLEKRFKRLYESRRKEDMMRANFSDYDDISRL
jgi:hypothetical protein